MYLYLRPEEFIGSAFTYSRPTGSRVRATAASSSQGMNHIDEGAEEEEEETVGHDAEAVMLCKSLCADPVRAKAMMSYYRGAAVDGWKRRGIKPVAIQQPLLLCWGTKDVALVTEQATKLPLASVAPNPKSRLQLFEASHWLQNEVSAH